MYYCCDVNVTYLRLWPFLDFDFIELFFFNGFRNVRICMYSSAPRRCELTAADVEDDELFSGSTETRCTHALGHMCDFRRSASATSSSRQGYRSCSFSVTASRSTSTCHLSRTLRFHRGTMRTLLLLFSHSQLKSVSICNKSRLIKSRLILANFQKGCHEKGTESFVPL